MFTCVLMCIRVFIKDIWYLVFHLQSCTLRDWVKVQWAVWMFPSQWLQRQRWKLGLTASALPNIVELKMQIPLLKLPLKELVMYYCCAQHTVSRRTFAPNILRRLTRFTVQRLAYRIAPNMLLNPVCKKSMPLLINCSNSKIYT